MSLWNNLKPHLFPAKKWCHRRETECLSNIFSYNNQSHFFAKCVSGRLKNWYVYERSHSFGEWLSLKKKGVFKSIKTCLLHLRSHKPQLTLWIFITRCNLLNQRCTTFKRGVQLRNRCDEENCLSIIKLWATKQNYLMYRFMQTFNTDKPSKKFK